ncbi:hypothetical protein ACFYZN_02365 [Streptomyces sp. NPDC001777]|uniref:hypothetical protein n=1 Tax=Streptomyces sp. NPDC001777 TaxID=3364608 RepID=UPI00369E3E50
MFPLDFLALLVGVFAATNFRGVSEKGHECFGGYEGRGFSSSCAQQRLNGVVLIAGGVYVLVFSAVHIFFRRIAFCLRHVGVGG